MRKFILPLILTAAVGIALLPSAAHAQGVLYPVPPAYVPPAYVPAYTYVPPVYVTPAPPVYVTPAPTVYVVPSYRVHYDRPVYRSRPRYEHHRR